MKSLFTLLALSLIFINFSSAQKNIYIDENGDTISKAIFSEKWRNKELQLSIWTYLDKNKKRYVKLKKDLYLSGTLKRFNLINELEKIISKKIPDSNTVIIKYIYKDDLCTMKSDNKWTKEEILKRKEFTNPIKKKLERKGITLIYLFESGIKLYNRPSNKKEYFFSDKTNFFRKKLFTNPTTCGSYAAFKTNGQTLIRNGEFRADFFAKYLKDKNWSLFF